MVLGRTAREPINGSDAGYAWIFVIGTESFDFRLDANGNSLSSFLPRRSVQLMPRRFR